MDKPLPVELVESTKVRIDGDRSIFYEDADEVTPKGPAGHGRRSQTVVRTRLYVSIIAGSEISPQLALADRVALANSLCFRCRQFLA